MTSRLRQVLTFVLLSLFSLENVVLVVLTASNESSLSQAHQYVQQGFQTMYPLLAEENEERDYKDEAALAFNPIELISLSPALLSVRAAGMKLPAKNVRLPGKSLPRYAANCSFIL